MSEHTHHHHHSHYSHDDAFIESRRALSSIERRKIIGKWLFRILCVVAVLMAIAVVVVYRM